MIHIKIPFKTPTVNSLYVNVKTKQGKLIRIMPEKYRKLKAMIEEIARDYKENAKYYQGKRLAVSIFITEDWLNKNKTIKKKDLANREKFIIDSIFPSLGIDDSFIWELSLFKEQSKFVEEVVIQIEELNSLFIEQKARTYIFDKAALQ